MRIYKKKKEAKRVILHHGLASFNNDYAKMLFTQVDMTVKDEHLALFFVKLGKWLF
ncbi:hypothetical protein [Lysinibacillus fusiformis]